MLSETLSQGLDNYRIGQKLRALRLSKGLGLAQLGEHTGLSAGMLSKLERGQIYPTLPTLLRISLVFGVGLDHFFVDALDTPVSEVVRAADRIQLPDKPGESPTYFFENLDFPVTDSKLKAYVAEFPPSGDASEPHAHDGVELVYIIRGALCVTIHDTENVLEAGDAMYFDSSHEHSYVAKGEEGCFALVSLLDEEAQHS